MNQVTFNSYPPLDQAVSSEPPLVIRDLLQRASLLRNEAGWECYQEGIQIRSLYQVGESGPAAALLRYEAGAAISQHEHLGHEHILVLDGAQSDEHGSYPAGTFIINRPHSTHRVASAAGCVVLIIWERRPSFLARRDAMPWSQHRAEEKKPGDMDAAIDRP